MSKRKTRITTFLSLFAVGALVAMISQSFANEAPTEPRYVAQYTASGEMLLAEG